VDGTGRLQTVFREQSPRYYRLIERMGQVTGVPVVLNTSVNLKGEPIVNTPANAYNTFSKSEMDVLVPGNFIIEDLCSLFAALKRSLRRGDGLESYVSNFWDTTLAGCGKTRFEADAVPRNSLVSS